MEFRNDATRPLRVFLLRNKVCLTYGFVNTTLPFSLRTKTFSSLFAFRRYQALVPSSPPICVDCRECRIQN
jgi:hypothetical protein